MGRRLLIGTILILTAGAALAGGFQVATSDASGSGPERIAPRWWTGAGRFVPRDYFAARDRAGSLWLLYRARRQWFVEGWWD